MTDPLLRVLHADSIPDLRRDPVDDETLEQARVIVDSVRDRGLEALREHAERFGDLAPGAPMVLGPKDMIAALESLPAESRAVLERSADRIRAFAAAQRDGIRDIELDLPGGVAGLRMQPVQRAGCYAPGGRFPLPSSVLMTAVTARAAGVEEVWVASPKPTAETLAAAALAQADAVLSVGGAQAIAALAYGVDGLPPCDVIVGPGNRWVTAAKQLVSGRVRIDMLAGPSELVVIADHAADPALTAADLLAQAEHDPDALPILIAVDPRKTRSIPLWVGQELEKQLADLPTADTARAALAKGFAVVVKDLGSAAVISDRLAPEHLALHVSDPDALAESLHHYGALFAGAGAAEVLGDYGAGPNHVLPTGGTARSIGALSVLDFLRVQTSLRIDDPEAAAELVADAAALGRMEGLEAHARAADRRRS